MSDSKVAEIESQLVALKADYEQLQSAKTESEQIFEQLKVNFIVGFIVNQICIY